MTFLGRAARFTHGFLGKASKGAAFLGRHTGTIQRAAMTAGQVANNPALQALAAKSQAGQKILGGISRASNLVNNGISALPQLQAEARAAGAALAAPKRTLADLYNMSK